MNLDGWMPVRVAWRGSEPRVEWTPMGAQRLLDPFFEQTVQRQMAQPFGTLDRRETTVEEMAAWADAHPGAPLKGIVYHMSRCGSTLIGRQLAALERNIVAQEPAPMDDVVRVGERLPGLTRAMHVRWLRAMAAALGQPRNGESAFYLKTDPWHIHSFDLFREAFPKTPWIFLYRDPVEVMVSQARIPGSWTVPGLVDPALLGMAREDWVPPHLDTYQARSLAKMCWAGLRVVQQEGGGLLVNYAELPEAMYGRLLGHFGLREEDVPAMREAAQQNAKSPAMRFVKDADAKQAEASERLRAVAAEHLMEVYAQLESERLAWMETARRDGPGGASTIDGEALAR
jgi:hypothetical protein